MKNIKATTSTKFSVLPLFALAVGGFLSFDCLAGTIEVSPVKAVSRPDLAVATPYEALERIRAARAKGDTSAWTVKVASGRHAFAEPLVFTPEDHDIAFVGEKGAVFAGGSVLGPWTDEGGGVWSTPIPTAKDGKPIFFESLYVNGRRAARARLPKVDGDTVGTFRVSEQISTPEVADGVTNMWTETVKLMGEVPEILEGASYDELQAVRMCAYVKWSQGAYPVESYDGSNKTFVVKGRQKVVDWKRWPWAPNYFVFENCRRGFTDPGEWFYDVTEGKVKYRPLKGERMNGKIVVTAPTARLVSLVRFAGDVGKGAFVRNIRFENIGFTETRTDGEVQPNGAVRTYQWQAAGTAGATVFGEGVHNAEFVNCRVFNTENYGFRFEDGCVSNRFLSCEIVDAGAGGFWLGGNRANVLKAANPAYRGVTDPWDHPFETHPVTNTTFTANAFNVIDDCSIRHCGRFNREGVGVVLTHASDCTITHNEIDDLYYTGISVGWTWGYYGSYAQRNEISFNRITDIGQNLMADMGGIYTLGASFGTVITNNVIMDVESISYGGWGLYNDEGSEGILWENNLVVNTSCDSYHLHFGRNNTVRNNILVNSGVSRHEIAPREGGNHKPGASALCVSREEGHHQVSFVRNVICWPKGPAFVREGWNRLRDGTAKVTWTDNVFWCMTGETEFNGPVEGFVADPRFVNPKKGNWNLKPDSPALKHGFQPFDPSLAGRRH